MTQMNAKVNKCLKQLSGALLLALCTSSSHGASYAGTQFEIEMVVFSRESGMAQSQESWPATPRLAYDRHWVDFDSPSSTDSMVPALQAAPNQLNNKVAALNADPSYQVLFHKTWRQVLQEQRDAPAVLINGGALDGAHHQLEGSVTMSVSRYLHLSTDLWLSEWLTPIENPRFSDTPEEFGRDTNALDIDSQASGIAVPAQPRTTVTMASQLAGDEPIDLMPAVAATQSQDYGYTASSDPAEPASINSDFQVSDNPSNVLTAEQGENNRVVEPQEKLAARVAVLKEERRLRSGELHYIDHPKLGILIEVRTVAQQQEPATEALGLELNQ